MDTKIHSIVSDYQIDNEFADDLKFRVLEQKFAYLEEGAEAYYKKNKLISSYAPNLEDNLKLEDYSNFICSRISSKERNVVIVLGCGNLKREAEIVKKISSQCKADLIGVDSSMAMLKIAKRELKKNGVEALLVHADFTKLEFRNEIDNLIKNYDKRIFAFIGGTLGNVNQTAIVDDLYNLLDEKKDLLWIDAQLRVSLKQLDDINAFNSFYSLTKIPERVNFWMLSLKKIGVNLSRGDIIIESEEEPTLGVLKFTMYFRFKTLTKVEYKGEIIHFSKNDKVALFHYRIYHAPTLIRFFKDHEFEMLDKYLLKKDGQFLFKKAK